MWKYKWPSSVLLLVAASLGCAHSSVRAPLSSGESRVRTEPSAVAVVSKQNSQDVQSLPGGPAILFGFNDDILTAGSEARLTALASVLRAHPATKVRIAGNCDERGTEEYNLALGARRAAVAKQFLVKLGVDPAHIDTISYGAERPADPSHNEEAWSANRRDELSALDGEGG